MRLTPAERFNKLNSVEARLRNRVEAPPEYDPLPLELEAAEEIAILRTAVERLTSLLTWSHGHHSVIVQAGDPRITADWNWSTLETVLKAPSSILEYDIRRPTAKGWRP